MENTHQHEKYFQDNKSLLKEVINSSAKTKYGRKTKIGLYPFETYRDFCQIPFSDSKALSENPATFVRGKIDKFVCVRTTGTTGYPKRIYYDPSNRFVSVPSSTAKILSQTKDFILFYGMGRREPYWMLNHTIKHLFPHIKILRHDDTADSMVKLAQIGDSIFIIDPVSHFKNTIFSLEKEVRKSKTLKNKLKKKVVIAATTGEEISIQEFGSIYEKIKYIFSVQRPSFVSVYGLTETDSIGLSSYNEKDKKIRYRVNDSKFVEAINQKTLRPCFEKRGEIVITALKWTTGTIIPRYRTGDIGRLSFKDGVPYLKIYGKKPSAGIISFRQTKINVPGIIKRIKTKFNIPLQSEFQISANKKTTQETLFVRIHSSAFTDKDLKKRVESFVENVIVNEINSSLKWKIKKRLCKLNLKLSPRRLDMIKGWKILPTRKI